MIVIWLKVTKHPDSSPELILTAAGIVSCGGSKNTLYIIIVLTIYIQQQKQRKNLFLLNWF